MKIINEKPPIYDKLIAAGINPSDRAIYTYGDAIYNPSGEELSPDVLAHEAVHVKQQAKIGKDVWWERFIADKFFRIEQESLAYARQYEFFCVANKERERRNKYLIMIAGFLSSPSYGSVITHQGARGMIKRRANV